MEGVDVYFLAKQMRTSVKMIAEHCGYVTPVKNADRLLQRAPRLGADRCHAAGGAVIARLSAPSASGR
jgi:hypothetical protein